MKGQAAHHQIHKIQILQLLNIAGTLEVSRIDRLIDIKPGNILIDREGEIKILDFGLAAQIRTSMTKVSVVQDSSGTAPYMSPEQWRGKRQNAASDQYALAVVAYEMFSGVLPFESTDPVVLKQAVLDEKPDLLTNVPLSVSSAVNKALSKKPEDRFESCSAFAEALTRPVVTPVVPVAQNIPGTQTVPVAQNIPSARAVPATGQMPYPVSAEPSSTASSTVTIH